MAQRSRPLDPEASALARYGALLRRWRLASGLSQAELGRKVHVSGDLIGKIEKAARRPTLDLVKRLDAVLDSSGALTSAGRAAHLADVEAAHGSRTVITGHSPPSPEQVAKDFHRSWEIVFADTAKDWRTDMRRREFVRTAGITASASSVAALQWLLTEPEIVAHASGSTIVGSDHVLAIRAATIKFRHLDNSVGGAAARHKILAFLVRHVDPLVQLGRYDARTGAELLSATAELMHLLGWATFDAGQQATGQSYLTRALRLEKAAGDEDLGAEILAALSHQASYLRDGRTALDLARAARTAARRSAMPVLVAETHVLEAHGHACLGASAACAHALSAAETTLDGINAKPTPAWIGYFDEAYLAAKFAHCFRELGDGRRAREFAERSLLMEPGYRRGRMFNLALLATSHAQLGDVEAACAVAGEAIPLATQLRSHRAVGYLRGLRAELDPYASSALVAALDTRLSDAGFTDPLGNG